MGKLLRQDWLKSCTVARRIPSMSKEGQSRKFRMANSSSCLLAACGGGQAWHCHSSPATNLCGGTWANEGGYNLSTCWLNPFSSKDLRDRRTFALSLESGLCLCVCTNRSQTHRHTHGFHTHGLICCSKLCSLLVSLFIISFPETPLLSWGLIFNFQTTELLWLTNLI